ncbi:MAG: ABC transporter substrate-binding protein [Desulfobacterota bacterium]|nr:ABC transporter substrate-binding protein [Thermodesulfobacteriota bacterium]
MKKVFVAAMLAVFWGFLAPGGSPAAEPIKFGFLHSLSGGTGQVYGIPDQEAAKLAVEEINKAGGVMGRPLEMIARDDKLNPENAVREAKDMILNHKVQWIQGTVSSAVALAVSAYCKEAKVPFIVTNAQSAAITDEKGHRYLFRISTNTTMYTRAVANAAAKTWGGKKIFIIGPDYEYGHRSKKDFMDAYTKLVPDAKIIGELWPKLGNQDWTPYISKIMSSGADFVYCSLWGGDVISFTKAAWAFGYFDRVKHCGQDWGNIEALGKMSKDIYPKGALGGSHYPFWAIDNPASKEFWTKFNKASKMYPGLAACGYTTVYAMKQAMEKAKAVDMEKVINALEGMELNTVVGKVQIRACDHQALWPFWVGPVSVEGDLPWPHITKPVLLDPVKGYLTCAEVEADRKK